MKRFFTLMLISAVALFSSCDEEQSIDEAEVVTISKVTLSTTSLGFSMGDESQTLTYTTTPAEAEVKSVKWSVQDANPTGCITVDGGVVTPVSVGTATVVVTATSVDGLTVSAECQVTVLGVDAESLSISSDSLYLKSGDYGMLTASVYPEYATETDVIWTLEDLSSDGCIKLLQMGTSTAKITGVSNGSATAKATLASDSTIYATCQIFVTVDASNLVLSTNQLILEIRDNDSTPSGQLSATFYPENAENQDVVWSVKDVVPEGCISVDQDGMVTTSGEAGLATVVATSASDSSITAECSVEVYFAVLSVTLDQPTLTFDFDNTGNPDAQVLTATVYPEDAYQGVVWEVIEASSIDCVTVDEYGVVTAHAIGEAKVVATSGSNSEMYDVCVVTVNEVKATSIALTDGESNDYGMTAADGSTTLYINISDPLSLTATVTPDHATYQTISWSIEDSSDEQYVTVSSKGVVSFAGDTDAAAGTATVVATNSASPNAITAKCKVESVWVDPTVITVKEPDGYAYENDVLLVSINTDEIPLTVAYTSIHPDNAVSDSTLTWTLKDVTNSCVTIDQVTGVMKSTANEGTATVVATSVSDGTVSGEVKISVSEVKATSITLTDSEGTPYGTTDASGTMALDLNIDEPITLIATAYPSNTSYPDVTWSIKDESLTGCVTVVDGVVTAVSVDDNETTSTATVVATSKSTGSDVVAECVVTVTRVDTETVTIDDGYTETNPLEILFGETPTLTATTTPETISYDEAIEWTSDDEAIVEIDPETGEITTIGLGTATITATAKYGATATCNVTVSLDVSIDPTVFVVSEGEKQITMTFYPESVADDYTVSWALKSGNCLSISSAGLVDPSVEGGEATITATITPNSGGTPITRDFEVSTATIYAVGDYYPTPDDATTAEGIVFQISNGGLNGKVISLYTDKTNLNYNNDTSSDGYNRTEWLSFSAWELNNGTSNTDGLANFASALAVAGKSITDYPIYNWINENLNGGGTDTSIYKSGATGVWYMPAIQEVREWFGSMYGLYDVSTWTSGAITASGLGISSCAGKTDDETAEFNALITAAGGDAINFGANLCSSTESSYYQQICLVIYAAAGTNAYQKNYDTSTIGAAIQYRAIMAF